MSFGLREVVSKKNDFGTELPHGVHFDLRGGARHHDAGADSEVSGRIGDSLSVVSGADGDYAAFS